jgi:hypothetical protein
MVPWPWCTSPGRPAVQDACVICAACRTAVRVTGRHCGTVGGALRPRQLCVPIRPRWVLGPPLPPSSSSLVPLMFRHPCCLHAGTPSPGAPLDPLPSAAPHPTRRRPPFPLLILTRPFPAPRPRPDSRRFVAIEDVRTALAEERERARRQVRLPRSGKRTSHVTCSRRSLGQLLCSGCRAGAAAGPGRAAVARGG